MSRQSLAEDKQLEKLEQAAEEVEQRQNGESPEAIQQQARKPKPHVRAKIPPFWFVPYLIAAAVTGAGILFLDWKTDLFEPQISDKIRGYLLGALGVTALLAVAKAVEVYAIGALRNPVARFNLKRVLHLIVWLAIPFIVVPVIFLNWRMAVAPLGLVSLVLGFALQTPISSLIAWIYILVRAPYRVGDRIQIGDARGDVIDVSYLDTTLWEIGGRHLSGDHPSGRLIKFPNTKIFSEQVYNYTWPLFPYIWNEIKLHIAYESNLEFVGKTMQKIAEEELGETMMEKVKVYRDLLARTPVDHLEVRERPAVLFRVSENTWIEAIVRYLVHPKESGQVKTRLTKKILAALNAQPEKVLFPKSNTR